MRNSFSESQPLNQTDQNTRVKYKKHSNVTKDMDMPTEESNL